MTGDEWIRVELGDDEDPAWREVHLVPGWGPDHVAPGQACWCGPQRSGPTILHREPPH
ncbi:MAG TPA: hypothetical protein VFJ24_01605 [Gaiellales bacterium]|nr:hypothetical protein [Gaiellales bacterium]